MILEEAVFLGGRPVAGFGLGDGGADCSQYLSAPGLTDDQKKQIAKNCQSYSTSAGQQKLAGDSVDAISDAIDYFKNPPNYQTWTHDQIKARDERLYTDIATVTTVAAFAIGGPALAGGMSVIFVTIEKAVVWFFDQIGFYSPCTTCGEELFGPQPNCASPPSGPDDPSWQPMPEVYDASLYQWSESMKPGAGSFEDFALTFFAHNRVLQGNCQSAIPGSASGIVLDKLVAIWNSTHAGLTSGGKIRRIDVDYPPPWPSRAHDCSGCDTCACIPPLLVLSNPNATPNGYDPITIAWYTGHFNFDHYVATGEATFDRSFFVINDGPMLPKPNPKYSVVNPATLPQPLAKKTSGGARKALIGTAVVGGAAVGGLALYAGAKGISMGAALRRIFGKG